MRMRLTDEFVQTAADNVERLLKAKDEARRSAVRRDDGSYVFTLGGSGSHAETKMTIEVSAENINSVFEKNLHTTLSDAADEKAKKMAILAQMPGADGEEKFSRYKELSDDDRKSVEDKAEQSKAEFQAEAEKALLVDLIVAPVLANRATQIAYQTAHAYGVMKGNPEIAVDKDHGYCTKALTHTLYEMKARYGGFDFLPENAEDAAHPMDFIRHMQSRPQTENLVHKTEDGVSLREEFAKGQYQAGTLAVIDQGKGHYHTMLYTGKIENGNPVFISFNNDSAALPLRNEKKGGYIFDMPAVLAAEEEQMRARESKNREESPLVTPNRPEALHTEEQVAVAGGCKIKIDIHRKIAGLRADMAERKGAAAAKQPETVVPSQLRRQTPCLNLINNVETR